MRPTSSKGIRPLCRLRRCLGGPDCPEEPGAPPCSALTSASGYRKKPFSSTTKPTGKASFYADRKWKIRPVDHLDLDRSGPGPNCKTSLGGVLSIILFLLKSLICPRPHPPPQPCPSVTGTTCRRCSPTPCPPPNSPLSSLFSSFSSVILFPEIPPPHLDPGQGA